MTRATASANGPSAYPLGLLQTWLGWETKAARETVGVLLEARPGCRGGSTLWRRVVSSDCSRSRRGNAQLGVCGELVEGARLLG